MDLVIGLLWSVAFTVIIVVLGALNYFLGQSHSDIQVNEKKSQSDSSNQIQQSNRTTTTTSNNRRKQNRNANKKQRQSTALATSLNSDQTPSESISSMIKLDDIETSTIQPNDDDQFEDPMNIEEEIFISSSHIEDEQTIPQSIKQHHNTKINSIDLIESIHSSKPQASVVPVKQSILSKNHCNDNHSKSNGNISTNHVYSSYQEYNSLPPRFQQQRQQQKNFLKKSTDRIKKSSFGRSNNSYPSAFKRQQQYHLNNNHQLDSPTQNGYSSESDALTESSSTAASPSIESQSSSKQSDFHSSSSSNHFLDEFISLFDQTTFNSDQLELILNKILTKHIRIRQDRQHSLPNRTEKTIETLLDETYHNQVKHLAIELQTEKNRVHELSKINAELDTTIQQLQQPNPNISSYQQTILHYQMHIKRLTDENARLIHQLHNYSIMPASINELKQQHLILSEQLRQITMRNNNLENEIADAERARRQAIEIYQKVETQKQDRIDQLVNDLNKYKKIEKDFQSFQDKHIQLETNFNTKLTDLTEQRDNLREICDELKRQIQTYEIDQNPDMIQRETELNELKTKNDLLKKRNGKIMDQLNKLLMEQKPEISIEENQSIN